MRTYDIRDPDLAYPLTASPGIFLHHTLYEPVESTQPYARGRGRAALWLGSMIVFATAIRVHELGEHPFASAINWLAYRGYLVYDRGACRSPHGVTLFFVAWTILAIFVYSVGYHNFGQPKGDRDLPGLPPHGADVTDEHGHSRTGCPSIEPMYARFFAFISLFAFAMYVLVVSDNLLTLYIGWEIMGLCSYLLIGFWYAKPSARDAAIKPFSPPALAMSLCCWVGLPVFDHWQPQLPGRLLRRGAAAASLRQFRFSRTLCRRGDRAPVLHWNGW
jgi:hypothetical protein